MTTEDPLARQLRSQKAHRQSGRSLGAGHLHVRWQVSRPGEVPRTCAGLLDWQEDGHRRANEDGPVGRRDLGLPDIPARGRPVMAGNAAACGPAPPGTGPFPLAKPMDGPNWTAAGRPICRRTLQLRQVRLTEMGWVVASHPRCPAAAPGVGRLIESAPDRDFAAGRWAVVAASGVLERFRAGRCSRATYSRTVA